ncbi:60S ribosomal protein L10 [Linum perenne]
MLRFSLPSGRQIHPHSPINSLLLLGFTLPTGRQIHPQNRRPNTFLLHQNLCFIVALLLATPPSSPIAKYQDLRSFGKHQGFCARVGIGQALLSVRCKDNNSQHAQEALRRAMFKFPGRQKIIVSRKCFLDAMYHWQTVSLDEHLPQK